MTLKFAPLLTEVCHKNHGTHGEDLKKETRNFKTLFNGVLVAQGGVEQEGNEVAQKQRRRRGIYRVGGTTRITWLPVL